MLDSDSACHDVRDLKSECACARGFANLASAGASSRCRGLDPFSPQLSWLRGPAARSAAAGPPHPNCCAALPPIGNASRPNNSVGAAACPPLCGAAAQRDPAALPRYAAGPPHLPCCAVLPPIGHASRPAPTARPAEFAGAASYTWTLIRMHAHTHARRQAQTHLKALAAASRPPANPDRRQQHASRTGRYSKCGRHWAGPARGGAGYALQPIVTSVGASSVSYRAIAPRRCRQSQCSCATGAGSTSASARTWRCARADAPRACQAPTGAWCLTRPSRPESLYAGCHLGLRGPSADWDGYIIVLITGYVTSRPS